MKKRLTNLMRAVRSRLGTSGGGLAVVAAVLVAFVLGFSLRGGDNGSSSSNTADASLEAEEEQWYTCSMHPEVRMPEPDDQCPICFMDLIPVPGSGSVQSAGLPSSGGGGIELSPEAAALIAVETVPVTRRPLTHRVRMVGQVAYDETRLSYLTAYAGGRLDRMYVDYTGVVVREGDHLAEIYSPELLVARQELVEARRAFGRVTTDSSPIARDTARAVLDAARERLRLLGLTPEQIEAAEAGRVPEGQNADHVTLYAPSGGVVIEKHAKPGSYVNEGDPLYTIADLSQVWVMLEAYESDLPWLRYGQEVEFTVAGTGDETFTGRIAFIDPTLDPTTRTVDVRVNVENPGGRLRPGVFVRASVLSRIAKAGRVMDPELAGKWISPMHPEVIRDEPGDCPVCGMDLVRADDWFESLGYEPAEAITAPLIVPQSAVLRTGTRGVIYVQVQNDPAPQFEGRTVELGPSGEGFVIVRDGLAEGELVVSRGNFQIDSALQIQAKPSMMNPAPGSDLASEQAGPPREHVGGPAADAIRELVTAVFAYTEALAADDATKAGQTTATIREAFDALQQAEVPAPLDDAVERVTEAITALNAGADIEEHREALDTLSQALIGLLQAAHVEGLGAAYRAYCPMAFGNRGASWLTPEEQVLNPYFGDRMLRCGSIEETLSAPNPAAAPGNADPHAGH
jgi:Cu(I)/Ag(I) efflux system membrane fusion protein